jgi:hypothetical protein
MKMWSQGLGKIELEVNARSMDIVLEDGQTKVKGVTQAPVEWNYIVTLEKDDIPAILHLALKWKTIQYVLRHIRQVLMFFMEKLFRRNKPEAAQEAKTK